MSRNGTGTYTPPVTSFPAVAGTVIESDKFNETITDIANALTGSISSDGQTATTAAIPFASGVKTDMVLERTTGAGVTIDGVVLKDGGIPTLAVSGGSALVGFTQATPATSGTVGAKLQQTVSVKDAPYSAKGDGVTDDTAAIQAAIDAISTAGGGILWFPHGTYLTDGILVKSNVWLFCGTATIKKRTDGSSTNTNALVRTVTYGYGNYSNIRIYGGKFDQNGKKCPAHILSLLYVDDMVLDGVTVRHDDGGSALSGWRIWGMSIGGRNVRISNCAVLNGDEVFEDGIHVYHGQRIAIENCYCECGDDAFPLGSEPTDVGFAANPDPIEYITISNCVVKSNKGFALKAYIQPSSDPAVYIRNVTVSNLTGTCGVNRSGGIWLNDNNAPLVGSSAINGITLSNISLQCGSLTHDETNDVGVFMDNVDDITIRDLRLTLTDASTVTGTAGFEGIQAINCTKVLIDGFVLDDVQNRFALTLNTCRDVTVSNSRIIGGTATDTIDVRDTLRYVFSNCSITDIPDGKSGIGLIVGTTNDGAIQNCKFSHAAGSTTGQAIGVIAAANAYLQVTGCDFSDAVASINWASVSAIASYYWDGNKDRNDVGTYARGTATITNGTTSVNVTHGMGLAPTSASQITITPTNNLGTATQLWVSSASGGATFTVSSDADPGAATATFAWQCFTGRK